MRFSGGTGAFGGRARGAMRGRDGITSQKTVRKPFEKAASVDVAALTALLRILECTGYKHKNEKNHLPRFFRFVVSEKRLKRTLSKKLPKLRMTWHKKAGKDSPS
jgi:hypothetical protein